MDLSCHSAPTVRRRRPLAGYAVMMIVKISDVSPVWRNHMCFPSSHADGGFPSPREEEGTCVYVLCNSDRSVEGILTATARNPLVSSTKKGGWMVGGAGEAVLQMRCI